MTKVHIMGWSKTLCGIRDNPSLWAVYSGSKVRRHKDACKRCLKYSKARGE